MTKEICEKCGKREWWHNPSNIHNSCKKFKPLTQELPQNHSPLDSSMDTSKENLKDKEPGEISADTSGSDNQSRFQNHINVIKGAKRIKDGSDDEPSRSERSLSDKINEKLRSIKEFMEEENAIYSPDYPKKQAEQRLLRTLKKDVKEFIKNIEKWSYIDLGKDIMKIRYSKFEELAGKGLTNG